MKNILVLLLLFGFTAVPVYAQSQPPTFTENEISTTFPEAITFHLELEPNHTDIKRILLRYGTNGRSCQDGGSLQSVDFNYSSTIKTEWEWELDRSGAIPPGARIWWQWEVEDEDGNITISDRQEHEIVDNNHRWQTIDRNGITVHWYRGDNAFGEAMYTQTANSLAHLQNDLGLPQPDNVQLWFYESGAAVQDALVNVPEWTGGVAFSEYGITVLGVAPGQDDWAADIVPHELTHLLEGILTFNCRGIDLPTWLAEGLARYAEGDADLDAINSLEKSLNEERLPSLKSLSAGFSAYSDGAGLAYTYSGQVAAYLIDTFGTEQMTLLLQTMQAGSDVDEAMLEVYGFDTNGLDVAWRTAQGYQPTPTSAADAAALAATPTPVPTIALGGIPQSSTATPTSVKTAVPTASSTPVATATLQATATIIATAVLEEVAAVVTAESTPVSTENTQPIKNSNFNWWLPLLIVSVITILVVTFWQYKKHQG